VVPRIVVERRLLRENGLVTCFQSIGHVLYDMLRVGDVKRCSDQRHVHPRQRLPSWGVVTGVNTTAESSLLLGNDRAMTA
jgi:hypothetical protein